MPAWIRPYRANMNAAGKGYITAHPEMFNTAAVAYDGKFAISYKLFLSFNHLTFLRWFFAISRFDWLEELAYREPRIFMVS